MRVFVLTTGRAASTTFASACHHIDGMSAGHETRRAMIEGRLDYPDQHIEVDNRLAWFLGSLDHLYSDADTFYVHLTRDPEQVARSYRERWHLRVSAVRAFYHGVLMHRHKPDADEALRACRLFVETVNDNIRFFLAQRDNWVHVRIENLEADFFHFMDRAGLTGDREKIATVLRQSSNISKRRHKKAGILKRLRYRISRNRLDLS